ncbi:Pentatricopeptide repeat-containing protein [Nymphaea thermarum]|nr:Pentatricopeptide repeat-containing protein [Nymphaea thermarum]
MLGFAIVSVITRKKIPRLRPAFLSYHADPKPLHHTQKLHARLLKSGLLLMHDPVASSLVRLYCESARFDNANKLLEEMPEWDLVSCTSLIGVFSKFDRGKDALHLFSRMLVRDVRPNQFTFGSVLHLCGNLQILDVGKQLHAASAKMGLHSNVFVGSAAADLYAKLGSMEDAVKAFDDILEPNVVSYTSLISGYLKRERVDDAVKLFSTIPERNVVSWNAMISGCSQTGHSEKALDLFVEMCRSGELPNETTFASVISAVGNIAAVGLARHLHACAVKSLRKLDVFVGNSLVSCYAKCGAMEESRQVFDRMPRRNIVSWNALIWGYAQNGRAREALDVFEEMKAVDGLRPNDVTLLCLLFACNHAGLVDEGSALFDLVKLQEPEILKAEHYACVVDLLSRAGRFREAETFLQKLPLNPGIGFWKALLGGCRIHSNMRMAELAAGKLLELDPEDVSSYVLLSNVYAADDRWHAVSKIRRMMYDKGMKRIPGCSWIEIRSKEAK